MAKSDEKHEKWLKEIEKRLHAIARDDNQIDLIRLKKALRVKKSTFADRFFEMTDTKRSGHISLQELIGALRRLVQGTLSDKLRFLFEFHDADGNGFVDFDELMAVLQSSTADSALTLSDETLIELTEVLFADADVDGDGKVTFEEFSEQFQRYPTIADNLTFDMVQQLDPKHYSSKKDHRGTCTCCSYHTLRNNLSVIFFTLVLVVVNIGMAGWGVHEAYFTVVGIEGYPHPAAICVARSSGRCLSFNCCFVLVLMLRKLLTVLRNSFLASALPLDHHVIIHKVVGVLIVGLSIVHVAGHLTNYDPDEDQEGRKFEPILKE